LTTALYIVQIILSIAIIVLVLLQVKGAGLGSIFGGDGGVYRTRRGVEKTIFNATIGLVILFFLLALVAVSFAG
jgi:preprotein translocase subunit SecG